MPWIACVLPVLVMVGNTPRLAAGCAIVCSPRIASGATYAVNSAADRFSVPVSVPVPNIGLALASGRTEPGCLSGYGDPLGLRGSHHP
ncbi:hypothetical protein C2U72_02555 [Prosthecomicrobium hirschii]|nr:hypothetical protein C2U72_02555 [Prosthecomicrobium hirschii]